MQRLSGVTRTVQIILIQAHHQLLDRLGWLRPDTQLEADTEMGDFQ